MRPPHLVLGQSLGKFRYLGHGSFRRHSRDFRLRSASQMDLLVVVLVLVSLAIWHPVNAADDAVPLADANLATGTDVADGQSAWKWMPADTVAVARIADMDAFRRQWKDSSFGAQLNDPAFANFFASVLSRLDTASERFGVDVPQLLAAVDGEVSLALVPKSPAGLSLIAVAEMPDSERAGQWVDRFENKLTDQNASSTVIKVDGKQLTSWQRNGIRKTDPSRLSYFRSGRQIVFSDGLQPLAETARLGFHSNPSADAHGVDSREIESLEQQEDFQHVLSRVSGNDDDSGLKWFVSPTAVIKAAVPPNIAEQSEQTTLGQTIDGLQVKQFRGFGGSFWLDKGGMDSVSMMYGYVDTPVEGIWKALKLQPARQVPPDWVKDDVSIYSQINWNGERFLETMEELIDRSAGEGSFDASVGSVKIADTSVKDLLGNLRGPIHIAAVVPESAQELARQRLVFAIDVEDPETLHELARSIGEQYGGKNISAADATVYQFPLDTPGVPGIPKLELALGVANGSLMFSPNADFLKEVASDDSGKRPLSESPGYQEIAKQFPEQSCVINYQRQDARLEGLYETLRSGVLPTNSIPGILGPLLNFDFKKLPPFPSMSRYLQSTGSYIVPEQDGFRIVSFATPPREQ